MKSLPEPILEICVDSLTSARAAQTGGADRIELCSALSVGGLSPSAGLMQAVRAAVAIPVYALIRPRAGDFCYDDDETATMVADIEYAQKAGLDGVVIGALGPTGGLDEAVLSQLIQAAQGLPLTFHRAFDVAQNPLQMVTRLIDLGFSTVLTSGQAPNAWSGRHLIRSLQERAGTQIRIMAGSGISPKNAMPLIQETGVYTIHASASQTRLSTFEKPDPLFEAPVRQTNATTVRTLRQLLHEASTTK